MENMEPGNPQSISFTLNELGKQMKTAEHGESQLSELNNILDAVCLHSGTMVIMFDSEGKITYFNTVAQQELGYTAAELLNIHTPLLFYLREELENKAAEIAISLPGDLTFIDAIAILNIDTDEWHFVRKDSSKLLVSLNIAKGEKFGLNKDCSLLLATNISEKKKPEMELRAALKKEKELNELKSRFVSMASHEFRTPLGGILSSAYLVSKYKKEEQQPQREKHIGQIVSSVNLLTEILDDFLSVGKIEEGNIKPNFVQFNVKDYLDKMIGEVKHLLKQYQNIKYTHQSKENKVTLDMSMFKHIVINLLSNAIKFSTDESTIEVYTKCDDGRFTLSVKDYGIGIPEEEQRNLFKIFFRSSFATNIKGTGLGLHIVKKYVEFMSGNINFKSEIGEGTEFIIQFNTNNT